MAPTSGAELAAGMGTGEPQAPTRSFMQASYKPVVWLRVLRGSAGAMLGWDAEDAPGGSQDRASAGLGIGSTKQQQRRLMHLRAWAWGRSSRAGTRPTGMSGTEGRGCWSWLTPKQPRSWLGARAAHKALCATAGHGTGDFQGQGKSSAWPGVVKGKEADSVNYRAASPASIPAKAWNS